MGDEANQEAPEVEARAKEMGWIPKEEFKGDEAKWIDAATFVERGETLLPIVKADRRRLEGEVGQLRGQLAQVTSQFQASQEAIEELKAFNANVTKERAKSRRAELHEEIKKAREDEDVEREGELMDELSEVNVILKEQPKARQNPPARQQQGGNGDVQQNPVLQAWMQENSWFGKDPERTHLAQGIAMALRADPANSALVGTKAFLDKVSARVEEIMPSGARRNGHDKVEGGARSSGGGSGGGKTYADLPADAKEVCEKQAKRLVGEGRAFKTVEDWRKHYVTKYFE